MEIKLDDLSDPRIAVFLNEHLEDMRSVSPPESKHALDLEALKQADIRFWSAWDCGVLMGCAALKRLNPAHAEIKSMRISPNYRGKGYASTLLAFIVNEAKLQGCKKLSLETGTMPFFAPARKLYQRFGFTYCAPFSNYKEDPNSVFMSLDLNTRL